MSAVVRASSGLLRAHVGGGADHLFEAGEQRLVGEVGLHGFGDAEVDDFGDRLGTFLDGDEDVAGFEIAVNDALLVGVLDGAADLEEEVEAGAGVELFAIAEGGDRGAADELHDEVRSPLLGLAAVEDFGDVRVVHHRERLALGLEARDDLAGVHAGFEDLDGDTAPGTGSVCSAMKTVPKPPSPMRCRIL